MTLEHFLNGPNRLMFENWKIAYMPRKNVTYAFIPHPLKKDRSICKIACAEAFPVNPYF